ncbi:LCP family protein [Planococcus liqunii]|uniref:LCP family glycopolymer transferase n=1 Tax=Planococcus liqunii TaxID=3058394 RepID=UPI002612AE07|nr:LCP family protein [Planococcus sp. N056]WKA50065.1 LCP family protein [Planococcus sp. N056]
MVKHNGGSRARKKSRWVTRSMVFLLLAGIVYLVILFPKASNTLDEIHQPIAREASPLREEKVVLEEKNPISVLLLGVDEREDDRGRSDTMIVLTINPTGNSTKMVSIPRDTYTEIVGLDRLDKINHAYAFGGIDMSLDTTEKLLDIPIDYVVQLNMEGFKDVIDALDGITVDNAFAFDDFKKGELTLTGDQALDFVQMRKQDPNGDFGRQDRQKQVIQSIMSEAVSATTLFNYPKIFDALGNNVKTNMEFSEMIDIQKNYRSASTDVEQLVFEKGYGETIGGIWYYMMDKEELSVVKAELKGHLGLK